MSSGVGESRAERARRRRGGIAGAAHRLFLERGYERTSYQDIADSAGVERNLVQYYFPKKDGLVIGLMDVALRGAERAASRYDPGDDDFLRLHLVAQVYFGFLLDERVRSLTFDVVSSRRMTDEIILFDEEWLRDRLDSDAVRASDFTDDMTMAVGGSYELCYQALANGRELDPRDLTTRMLVAFMASLDEDAIAARIRLDAHRLSDDELGIAVQEVLNACLHGLSEAPAAG